MPDLTFRDLDYDDHKAMLLIHALIGENDLTYALRDVDGVLAIVIERANMDFEGWGVITDRFHLVKFAAEKLLKTIAAHEEEELRRDREAIAPKLPLDDNPAEPE